VSPAGSAVTGRRIRQARMSAGLSLAGFSRLAGFPSCRVGTWERGEREISVTSLLRVAQALGVPAASLLPDGPDLPRRVLAAAGWLAKAPRVETRAGAVTVAGLAQEELRRGEEPGA